MKKKALNFVNEKNNNFFKVLKDIFFCYFYSLCRTAPVKKKLGTPEGF